MGYQGLLQKNLVLMIGLCFILSACTTTAEGTISQAQEELNFPVLVPNKSLVGWDMVDTIFEDDLLVIRYTNQADDRIELVQDQNIHGLDLDQLRQYVVLNYAFKTRFGENEIVKVDDYVGEISYFMESPPTILFTFVPQSKLFFEVDGDVPFYQVIGRGVSKEKIIDFVEALEVSS